MVIDNRFGIGDIVYQIIDREKKPLQVVELRITKADVLYNCVRDGGDTKLFYEFELTSTPTECLVE